MFPFSSTFFKGFMPNLSSSLVEREQFQAESGQVFEQEEGKWQVQVLKSSNCSLQGNGEKNGNIASV